MIDFILIILLYYNFAIPERNVDILKYDNNFDLLLYILFLYTIIYRCILYNIYIHVLARYYIRKRRSKVFIIREPINRKWWHCCETYYNIVVHSKSSSIVWKRAIFCTTFFLFFFYSSMKIIICSWSIILHVVPAIPIK